MKKIADRRQLSAFSKTAKAGCLPGLGWVVAVLLLLPVPLMAQEGVLIDPADAPIPIDVTPLTDTLEDRLKRTITLDVRDMSVMDVIRFLAQKGEFNLVANSNVQGRATFYLKSVTIKDALDIAVISSQLAYHIENEIMQVMSENDYEVLFGKRFNDRNIVEIVHLHYAKPSYVLAALDNIKSNLGRIIIDEETGSVIMIDTPKAVQEMKKVLKDIEVSLDVVVYTLHYAKADLVAEKLQAKVDALTVGSIDIDERTNKLIVRAFPGRRKEVEKLIEDLDSPTKEVMIDVRVLQVVFKPQHDYGIDWQMDFRNSNNKFLKRTQFDNIFLNEANPVSSDNLFSKHAKIGVGDFDVNSFELDVRALKQVSDTKILSNPKILVTNNEEAKIHIGDTVPYIISTTSGTGDNAITSEDVRFVDVGLKLNVTPTISENGFVTMLLNPEISTVTTSISSQGGGIPQVNKTEVQTTVMVKDGLTVILGGLKKENKVKTHRGIPLLMHIPYLGKVFSSSNESIELTEIVIFITPHIIKGDEGLDAIKGTIKPLRGVGQEEKEGTKSSRLKLKT